MSPATELRCPLGSEHRVLCVVIDDQLSWTAHIDAVLARAGRKIGCLRRVHRQLSHQARRMYLLSVITPTLEYGSNVFCMQASAKDRERLLAIYRRAVRAACGASRDAPVDPLMDQLNIRSLEDSWLLKLGVLVYRCTSGHSADCLASLFCNLSQSSTRCTRAATNKSLVVPRLSLRTGRTSIPMRLSVIWNSLPADSRLAPSVAAFKVSFLKILDSPLRSRVVQLAFGSLDE